MREENSKNQGVSVSAVNEMINEASSDSKNSALLESVSALMDGEASELELRRVLRSMADVSSADSRTVQDAWRRYHLVSASLKQEVHSNPGVNLLSGIQARLAEENQPLNIPYQRKFGGLLRKVGQVAVAASVTFTVLYGASQVEMSIRDQDATGASSMVADNSSSLPELGGDYTNSELTRTVSMDAAARERIQRAVQLYSGSPLQSFGGEAYTFPVQQDSTLQNQSSE